MKDELTLSSGSDARTVESLTAEIRALRELVDQLPMTVNGVRVVGSDMEKCWFDPPLYWNDCGTAKCVFCPASEDREIRDLHSTKESALAKESK